jgi:serine/threonine-protein kinase RsbW
MYTHSPRCPDRRVADQEKAEANRAYVRRLLWEKQPEFARALESATRELRCTHCLPSVATFPGKPEAVGGMRAALRRALDGCPVADDILLCASELAANAILHSDSGKGGGTFTVLTEVSPGESVLLKVEDDGGPWLERSREPTGGRGLGIVSALASACGFQGGGGGRTAWARFEWAGAA